MLALDQHGQVEVLVDAVVVRAVRPERRRLGRCEVRFGRISAVSACLRARRSDNTAGCKGPWLERPPRGRARRIRPLGAGTRTAKRATRFATLGRGAERRFGAPRVGAPSLAMHPPRLAIGAPRLEEERSPFLFELSAAFQHAGLMFFDCARSVFVCVMCRAVVIMPLQYANAARCISRVPNRFHKKELTLPRPL